MLDFHCLSRFYESKPRGIPKMLCCRLGGRPHVSLSTLVVLMRLLTPSNACFVMTSLPMRRKWNETLRVDDGKLSRHTTMYLKGYMSGTCQARNGCDWGRQESRGAVCTYTPRAVQWKVALKGGTRFIKSNCQATDAVVCTHHH
jgi:hypothetical protein